MLQEKEERVLANRLSSFTAARQVLDAYFALGQETGV